MKKYDVCVKVEMYNGFEVYANSEAEASDKAKQAMEDIYEYNITYDAETEDVEFAGSYGAITVVGAYEENNCDSERQ